MKLSHLILIVIIAISAFYIQVRNPDIVTLLYLTFLGFGIVCGMVLKDVNITHISIFLFLVNLVDYVLFGMGIIDLSAHNNDYLVLGSLVFGIQFVVNLIAIAIFLFRVQISRAISKSKSIELTNFDGLFHWFFMFLAVICFLAFTENAIRNVFDLDSFEFIYDYYEILYYIPWALTCGTLLTMMICSVKDKNEILET